jgi:hypothetical protein
MRPVAVAVPSAAISAEPTPAAPGMRPVPAPGPSPAVSAPGPAPTVPAMRPVAVAVPSAGPAPAAPAMRPVAVAVPSAVVSAGPVPAAPPMRPVAAAVPSAVVSARPAPAAPPMRPAPVAPGRGSSSSSPGRPVSTREEAVAGRAANATAGTPAPISVGGAPESRSGRAVPIEPDVLAPTLAEAAAGGAFGLEPAVVPGDGDDSRRAVQTGVAADAWPRATMNGESLADREASPEPTAGGGGGGGSSRRSQSSSGSSPSSPGPLAWRVGWSTAAKTGIGVDVTGGAGARDSPRSAAGAVAAPHRSVGAPEPTDSPPR